VRSALGQREEERRQNLRRSRRLGDLDRAKGFREKMSSADGDPTA
jgi:hypothetical protein